MCKYLALIIICSPLISAILVGVFGGYFNRVVNTILALLGVFISAVTSGYLAYQVLFNGLHYEGILFNWLNIDVADYSLNLNVAILIDKLTAIMIYVVTFISFLVHVYTIGYMHDEKVSYNRFFSYISLFTFMMLILVMSNNLMQLFFGWEGVGLVSYLLIGFYYNKESAIFANLKAFLVNRVGDFGFLLGIGLIYANCHSLNYNDIFVSIPQISNLTFFNTSWNLVTVICICLFIGAMGKSAQFPLHIWLPDSMEGPTPISALIHAATMVTAGIFMVSRLSPLYAVFSTANNFIAVIGAINVLFLGIVALVQSDIKKIVAYSTLSQLGYMVVALGCGGYSISIFHLLTHAFFKALLFLCAGSVIVALHHEQNIFKMGGLWRKMPITYVTMLIGSLALAGIPPFAGFFSKDLILELAKIHFEQGEFGSGFVLFSVYASVFITALYSFRLIFIVFHGKENFHADHVAHEKDRHHQHEHHDVHECGLSIVIPLLLLAIPSLCAGMAWFYIFTDMHFFQYEGQDIIKIMPIMEKISEGIEGIIPMIKESFVNLPLYLAISGIFTAWLLFYKGLISKFYLYIPKIIVFILENSYFIDSYLFNTVIPNIKWFSSRVLYKTIDLLLIDKLMVDGSAWCVSYVNRKFLSKMQTGIVNQYIAYIVIGIVVMITFFTPYIFIGHK
jgi:NADH-quinone oxidoreductase subunit L